MSILTNIKTTDLKYSVALSAFNKFGPVRFARLLKYFPDMKSAWGANIKELALAGIDEKIAGEFFAYRQRTDPGEELEKTEREDIKVLTISCNRYPKMLKEIYGPPPLLYYKGALPDSFDF